jgi:hypothetical protein
MRINISRGTVVSILPLAPELTRDVLMFLGVSANEPSVSHLDALVKAYSESVPWESFFRIAKRARTDKTEDCPRWPEEFWQDALTRGGGGTCFESNYAFLSLLRTMGYDGYLTANNMGDLVGCHSAIILDIDGETWLTDVGIPLYIALLVDPAEVTERSSRFHNYAVRPDGANRFQIERDNHPKPNIYTLCNLPVDNPTYRRRVTDDYGEKSLFLDRAIVTKVIDGQIRRFDSAAEPPRIEAFEYGTRASYEITVDVAEAVSRQFDMDIDTVRAALGALKR